MKKFEEYNKFPTCYLDRKYIRDIIICEAEAIRLNLIGILLYFFIHINTI